MYIYKSHLAGFYASNEEIKDTYCPDCGYSDLLIGNFNTSIDFIKYYANNIDIDNSGNGCLINEILSVVERFNDKIAEEEIIKIVLENQSKINNKNI